MSEDHGGPNTLAETEIQGKLLIMWKDILQQTDIGIHDNFVDLGGDSLSAMLCISRARTTFGVELFIEDFFMDSATIEGLTAIIARNGP